MNYNVFKNHVKQFTVSDLRTVARDWDYNFLKGNYNLIESIYKNFEILKINIYKKRKLVVA